ncbi:MAG: transposase, partial [Cyanobacteria bacterium J06628_3]
MKAADRKYRHNNHSVGSATVHLVWIPKRRKPVLVEDVKKRLHQIITEDRRRRVGKECSVTCRWGGGP